MMSNKGKSTAVRKPLAEISNGGGGGKELKSSCKKKKAKDEFEDKRGRVSGGGTLDRLLLLRSDLAGVVEKIDELVAYAINHKVMTNNDRQEVQSFSDVLSETISSLKPWIPRLQKMLSHTTTSQEVSCKKSKEASGISCADGKVGTAVVSNNKSELEMMLSPSPLVSWRDGSCKLEGGKQLFLLTPIPKSKHVVFKQPGRSPCVGEAFATKVPHNSSALPPLPSVSRMGHSNVIKKKEIKLSSNLTIPPNMQADTETDNHVASPMNLPCDNGESSVYLLTPCEKVILSRCSMHPDPVARSSMEVNKESKNATHAIISKASDDTFDEISETLSSRYQELFGLQPSDSNFTLPRDVDETLDWFLSPPKTCILLEPSDDKVIPRPHVVVTPGKGTLLTTPMWKDSESTANRSKLPGENTLKKELWTRFEAVSTNALKFGASASQRTAKKGFLDMLEEASS